MKIAVLLIAGLAVTLGACSGDAPPPPASAAAKPAKPLPNSNIFSSDIRALNKAKNVQNVVDKQKKDLDKAVKDSGG